MHVLKLKSRDVSGTSRLARSIMNSLDYYSPEGKKYESSQYSPKKLLESLNSKDDLRLVAKNRGRVIGFLFGYYDYGTFWADWAGVEKDYRRMGVGEALMLNLEKVVAGRCHKIWCDSRVVNKESIGLLEKLGYRKIATLENHWYGQDFFLWEKFLE